MGEGNFNFQWGGDPKTQKLAWPRLQHYIFKMLNWRTVAVSGSKPRRTVLEQLKGVERGKILNSNEVGSQIFATPHCPHCKLSKNASFLTIGQVEVVENEGRLSCREK